MEERTEFDALGEVKIPADAYFGVQTKRAADNFPITGYPVHSALIKSLALVKKAAIGVNMELDMIEEKKGLALLQAAQEIIDGNFLDQFIVDTIQGGAGTSFNMNMNEVLANRALEILEEPRGNYRIIHPNNHVNMGQSTNDVVPTAIRLGAIKLLDKLMGEFRNLINALQEKAREFDGVVKMGRTHLQDAVPIRLGQELKAFSRALERDVERMNDARRDLMTVNLGATAIGTGLNAHQEYVKIVTRKLRELTELDMKQAPDLIDATQNQDELIQLSGCLRTAAVNFCKMANDFRLLASGPRAGFNEIDLPAVQPGSSIMPGKVNPVIPEVINQISFQVQGNDHTVALAGQAGQLELNVMMPVLVFNLYQSLDIMVQGARIFYEKCIRGLTAHQERCRQMVEESLGIITAISPHIGYEAASRVAEKALETGRPLRQILLEEGMLSSKELDIILDPLEMTEPGIAGAELLRKISDEQGRDN